MTTGKWFARIGRAVAREETFERMIAPAISDLQVEAPQGYLLQWRHYTGIMAVLIHALLQDLRVEVFFAFNAAGRAAWTRAAVWYAFFVTLLTSAGLRYKLPPNLSLDGIWVPAVTSTGLEAIVSAVVPAMMAAALYLTRRSCSRRSIVLVTLLAAALTTAFAMTVRPLRMSAERTLDSAIHPKVAPATAWSYSDRLDARVTWWQDIQNGVQVIPFALLGILLARRKGWGVVLGIAAYFASWTLVVVVLVSRFRSFGPHSLIAQRWIDIGLNFIALIILFTVDRISRRIPSDPN